MRVSVIDLGTFSAILLIAETRRSKLVPIVEDRATVDMSYVRGRTLSAQALDRAARAIQKFSKVIVDCNVEKCQIVATAALRHATNRDTALRKLHAVTREHIRVLSGKQEAMFSARGAIAGLKRTPANPLIVDIGGGSTEILNPSASVFRGLPIGAVWATDQWRVGAPRGCQRRELHFLASAEKAALDLDASALGTFGGVIGVGGTITTLAAIEAGLSRFDVKEVHGRVLTSEWIGATAAQLSASPERRIKQLVPFDTSRSRVLLAGTYLWSAVLNRLNIDRVTVSARGLRWGVAAHLAGTP